MNTNLNEQLDTWTREQLRRFGYVLNTSDPLIDFFIYRIRYPDDIPRVVYKSRELVQQTLSPDVQTALTTFEAVVRSGAPLRPYMTKSIEQSDFFDGLLFDWGFYHFHMGIGSDKKDAKYIQRSEHLLIARIHLDQMYFIKIVPHKNAEWYKDELVRIYADNWPEVAEFGRMEFVDGLTEQIDEKQRKILRDEIHVNSPVDLGDGRVYMGPNLGITGRGTPVIATMWAQRAQRNAALMQKFMEEKEKEIIEAIRWKVDRDDFEIQLLEASENDYTFQVVEEPVILRLRLQGGNLQILVGDSREQIEMHLKGESL